MGGGLGKYSDTDTDVTGLTSAAGGDAIADNEVIRGDGTTGIQGSNVRIADDGTISGPPATTTTTAAGLAFTNQPANDGVELVSDNAGDVQTATIIGTTTGTDTVVAEDVVLNGVTFVPTVKVNWGVILAIKLSSAAVGTITVREASGDLAITTLAPAATAKGVETVAAAQQAMYGRLVSLVASGATTKQLGLKGTNTSGATIYDSQALTGATSTPSNSAFATVTEIYTGDLEATRTATVAAFTQIPYGSSIVGGVTGSSTLTLDGDPTVAGSVSITPGGLIRVPDGSAVGVGIGFSGSAASGLFRDGGGDTVLQAPGGNSLYLSGNGNQIKWQGTWTFPASASVNWGTDTGIIRASAGILNVTDGSTGIRGLLGGGAAVASAAALPLPTGRVFHVTGTTDVTSITSTNFQAGVVITLIFDGILTFTDGNNLKLAGNFVTSADDTITLAYDGSSWFEVSRSVN